jgi:hypothetical protein
VTSSWFFLSTHSNVWKNHHCILSRTVNVDIDPYILGTWELNLMLPWWWKPHFNSRVMDFMLNECDMKSVNNRQQNIPRLMTLKINLKAGSSFHCLSMTWAVPADFRHDTPVMLRDDINLTPIHPKQWQYRSRGKEFGFNQQLFCYKKHHSLIQRRMSWQRKSSHIEGTLTKNCITISRSQILNRSLTVHNVPDYRLHSQGSNENDPRLSIYCYARKVTRVRVA